MIWGGGINVITDVPSCSIQFLSVNFQFRCVWFCILSLCTSAEEGATDEDMREGDGGAGGGIVLVLDVGASTYRQSTGK